MPHEKYIPNLLQLYQLDKRAGKATPESGQENLEGLPDEILEGADQFRFRSALGSTSVRTALTSNVQSETSANSWPDRLSEQSQR